MKTLAYLLLAALTAGWLWSVGVTLSEGHAVVNTTQHVPWGLWVAFYIFFLGLSAGSFLLSSLVYVFGLKRFEAAGPTALLQAIGCLLLGGFLIVMDLGHPERGYKVLTSGNLTSVMAWMGIFYLVYVLVVVVELYLAVRPGLAARAGGSRLHRWLTLGYDRTDESALAADRRRLRVLGIVGIPVAIIVHGGVGSIFAVAKARPGWFSGLFPIVFLVSALASGGALLTFLTAAFSRLAPAWKAPLVRDLARLSLGILAFDALLLLSEILVTFYGNVPRESTGWRLTLFGPFWWVFWFVQLGLGLVVPAFLATARRTRASVPALGAAGFLVVCGILGARLNLVIPPQIQPAFDALPEAYHHPRWEAGYFPSATEWMLALGTVAVGTWLFLAARRVLPLEETT